MLTGLYAGPVELTKFCVSQSENRSNTSDFSSRHLSQYSLVDLSVSLCVIRLQMNYSLN